MKARRGQDRAPPATTAEEEEGKAHGLGPEGPVLRTVDTCDHPEPAAAAQAAPALAADTHAPREPSVPIMQDGIPPQMRWAQSNHEPGPTQAALPRFGDPAFTWPGVFRSRRGT